jgi:PAS domain S-box-containing protein
MSNKPERPPRLEENARLRARLAELEETLRAIRSGEVDALVVETAGENRIFTLHGADQTYRLMVEQMQKGAATLSQDGLVLYCNPFLAALLDIPLEAVLGASLFQFLDPPTGRFFSRLLSATANGVSRGELSFLRGKGVVLTQVSITVLTLEGTFVYCMIVTDLTERKRREEERLQLEHEQVARAVAEDAHRAAQVEIERRIHVEESLLLAEMDRNQLLVRERMARNEAEEANRLKDEFVATLSHELRTPLSAILTWSHVLRQPGLEPQIVARAIEAIDRNARAQSALVADLLDLSKIVTGQFHLDLGPVSLADVIESAADTMRPASSLKEIRLDVTIEPRADLVLGDASRLQQVVWNLLSNAIRVTPAGGRVQVTVSSAPLGVELSVMDDGAGIDPRFLPHVFDRFRQADSSSTRPHAGLGLGLAIVRHLVELHGGSVEAHNRTGSPGAVFIVRLRRLVDPEPLVPPAGAGAAHPEEGSQAGRLSFP